MLIVLGSWKKQALLIKPESSTPLLFVPGCLKPAPSARRAA